MYFRVGFWQNGFFADFYFWAAGFFRGFSRRIFSPHFCGKKCPEKSSKKIPGKILQKSHNKNPRHVSAEGPGQCIVLPILLVGAFFLLCRGPSFSQFTPHFCRVAVLMFNREDAQEQQPRDPTNPLRRPKRKIQRTPWGGGKKRGGKPHEWHPSPKRGFGTPPRTVRFPPPSGVSALFFLYKNPRQSRPKALLEGSKNFRESAFSGTSSSPHTFCIPPYHGPKNLENDIPCPSIPWFLGFPWLILSKEFPWLFWYFLCLFQGFCGFGSERKSLVNLRFFLGKTEKARNGRTGFFRFASRFTKKGGFFLFCLIRDNFLEKQGENSHIRKSGRLIFVRSRSGKPQRGRFASRFTKKGFFSSKFQQCAN